LNQQATQYADGPSQQRANQERSVDEETATSQSTHVAGALEGEKLAPFNLLPNELLIFIFQLLVTEDISSSLKQLKHCTLVCWGWKRLIGVPKLRLEIVNVLHKFAPEMAFGKAKWEKYFGELGVEPPLPKDIHTVLESPCPFWPYKKVKETHLLVLIPKTVNNQPLTLRYMGELVRSPIQGNKTQFDRDSCFDVYEELSVDQSHWVLMTRDILPDSRNTRHSDQLKLIQNYNQKSGVTHEVPKLLDATICIFLEYVQSGTRLYPDNPLIYTRCQERFGWGHVIVGEFSAAGLYTDSSYGYHPLDDADKRYGVSVCRIMS